MEWLGAHDWLCQIMPKGTKVDPIVLLAPEDIVGTYYVARQMEVSKCYLFACSQTKAPAQAASLVLPADLKHFGAGGLPATLPALVDDCWDIPRIAIEDDNDDGDGANAGNAVVQEGDPSTDDKIGDVFNGFAPALGVSHGVPSEHFGQFELRIQISMNGNSLTEKLLRRCPLNSDIGDPQGAFCARSRNFKVDGETVRCPLLLMHWCERPTLHIPSSSG